MKVFRQGDRYLVLPMTSKERKFFELALSRRLDEFDLQTLEFSQSATSGSATPEIGRESVKTTS